MNVVITLLLISINQKVKVLSSFNCAANAFIIKLHEQFEALRQKKLNIMNQHCVHYYTFSMKHKVLAYKNLKHMTQKSHLNQMHWTEITSFSNMIYDFMIHHLIEKSKIQSHEIHDHHYWIYNVSMSTLLMRLCKFNKRQSSSFENSNDQLIFVKIIKNNNFKINVLKIDDFKIIALKNDDSSKNNNFKINDFKNDDFKKNNFKISDIKNDDFKNDDFKKNNFKISDIKNDDVKSDDIKNNDFKNDDVKNDDFKNDDAKNDDVKNDDAKNDDFKINKLNTIKLKNDDLKSNKFNSNDKIDLKNDFEEIENDHDMTTFRSIWVKDKTKNKMKQKFLSHCTQLKLNKQLNEINHQTYIWDFIQFWIKVKMKEQLNLQDKAWMSLHKQELCKNILKTDVCMMICTTTISDDSFIQEFKVNHVILQKIIRLQNVKIFVNMTWAENATTIYMSEDDEQLSSFQKDVQENCFTSYLNCFSFDKFMINDYFHQMFKKQYHIILILNNIILKIWYRNEVLFKIDMILRSNIAFATAVLNIFCDIAAFIAFINVNSKINVINVIKFKQNDIKVEIEFNLIVNYIKTEIFSINILLLILYST